MATVIRFEDAKMIRALARPGGLWDWPYCREMQWPGEWERFKSKHLELHGGSGISETAFAIIERRHGYKHAAC